MRTSTGGRTAFLASFLMLLASLPLFAQSQYNEAVPKSVSFTTLITTPRVIEGLTGDNGSNLYTAGSGAPPCPFWEINIHRPALTVVGNVPASLSSLCTLRGVQLDAAGNLYVTEQAGVIYRVTPNASSPPDATVYASGVPGANGMAFDKHGNLWVSDGLGATGRVWKITGAGANCTPPNPVKCTEVFRIQPMRNSTALGATLAGDGIGRQNRVVPPATLTITSGTFPIVPAGGQDLVANGLQFDLEGNLYNIDTARGALWRITFDARGNLTSPTGCDKSFSANTLCLSNVLLASPVLEGGDGIILDVAGNIWVDANERNAIALITKEGKVEEVYRNPLNAEGLRNSADPSVGNDHILEFPTSPVLNGTTFCTAQSDMDRRDNSPAAAGESDQVSTFGKISCMDAPVPIPGLPLPIR